ncbi:MAG: aldehyde dehydrogenase family protein [Deltaproteobacteria bacterium]|nr:aldehyde dehydrogenase family protein [Deltaproteobacteria bacterium]
MSDTKKMFINGEWVAARGNKTRDVINPATGKVMAQVPEAQVDDVKDAVKAAREAFDNGPWGKTLHRDRGALLFKVAEGIRARAAELAEIDTRNMGKPIVEAEYDAADAAHCFEYYGGMASKVHGMTLPVPDNAVSMTLREPVGVTGQIIPWNYPLLMAAWKLAPALAAGCTSVLKPAEQSPLSALILAEILTAAGLPKGVVNIITGDGPVAGAALVADPLVDKIAFTGGTDAGRIIVKSAADTMKRTTMELGGKNPNIVFADADFDAAVDGALFGAFANQGEVCSAGSRLLVEKSIYEKMCGALAEKVKRVTLGDPLLRETKMGPLVSAEQRDRVMNYIEIGKKEAKLLCGGNRGQGALPSHLQSGYYVEPTIFRDVDNKMRIAQEEIFGPVLVVIPFDDEADAIRIANDTPYGLAGAAWTRDVFKGMRVLKALRAGILWLNTYHPTYNEAPWGGYKQSGFGRELGVWGIENYLETKQININLSEAPLGWY